MKEGTILIIDNDIGSNDIAENFLNQAGYETFACKIALDGIKIIKEKFNEIILVLLEPSLKNSTLLIKTIKENKRYAHIKLIIYLSKTIKLMDYEDPINYFKF